MNIISFLQGIKEEIGKITYPDKQAVINATKSIALIVLFASLYMEVIDLILKGIFKYVLRINL
ncbi:MAG: preprotein translocase subunit SecE [bacterium]